MHLFSRNYSTFNEEGVFEEQFLIPSFSPPHHPDQTHRRVWSHNVRVGVAFPEGLSARGS